MGSQTIRRIENNVGLKEAAYEEPKRRRFRLSHKLQMIIILMLVGSVGLNIYARSITLDKLDGAIASLDYKLNELKQLRSHMEALVASSTAEQSIMLKTVILKPQIDRSLAREIAHAVHVKALQFNRDPDLILAIIEVESNFNPQAKSSVGALGLMQIMQFWKKELGVEGDLKDIHTNIDSGLKILGFYDAMYEDFREVLSAYNRGPGQIEKDKRAGKDPTRNGYADKVLQVRDKLKYLSYELGT